MAEPLDLKSIERRPLKYWHADGLPELVMGLLWIVWGSAWLFGQSLPRGPAWNIYWSMTPVLLVSTSVVATWAIKKLKTRVTFPRAGYVEWKEPTRGRRVISVGVAVVAGAAIATLIAMTRRADGLESVAAPGAGVVLSLGFIVASLTQRAPHLLILAGAALVLGLALGTLSAGWDAMNWLLVALGASTMIVGALRLRMFLLRNPIERPA
jgi:hypothetical protein